MKALEIWELVNENHQIVQYIFDPDTAVSQGFRIQTCTDLLKKRIPALYGIDPEKNALIFQSEDEGLVCVMVAYDEESGIASLAFSIGAELE